MRLATIASSSSGNCIYIGSNSRNILIDDGIPLKRVEAGLAGLGLKVSDLDAIFITHEHADHIGGLGVLLRRYPVPVYLSRGTLDAINTGHLLGSVPEEVFMPLMPGRAFGFGDMEIYPFAVSHDAAEPVMYRISCGGSSAAVLTDLGYYDESVIGAVTGTMGLVLESNHDLRMLQAGPYPYSLKRRICSDHGHLSNEAAGHLLTLLHGQGLSHVLLGHLSPVNNLPELALEAVRAELAEAGVSFTYLGLAPKAALSDVIEV